MKHAIITFAALLLAPLAALHGGTPLHWAAALGRIEMAGRVIDAGADVNAKDNHGFTPLDATKYDPESNKKAKLEIAELLREKGGKPHLDEPRRQPHVPSR